jgi:4-oxalocrotonate tautomerase
MPHVIVKLWPGKSEQQKTRLAEAIIRDVIDLLHYGEESVSVAMEEIKPSEWLGGESVQARSQEQPEQALQEARIRRKRPLRR